MKRKIWILPLLVLLVLLSGCFEKELENKSLSLHGSKTLDFCVGEAKTLTAELPQGETQIALGVKSNNANLTAELSQDNVLTLSSNTAGEYSITFELSAKGYKTATVEYPVKVTLKSMRVSVAFNESEISDGISLTDGASAAIVIESDAENCQYSVIAQDQELLNVLGSNNSFTLSALAAGKTSLDISVTASGYEPYSITVPINIAMQPAKLLLAKESVQVAVGQTVSVPCDYQSGGVLKASCDNEAVNVSVSGGSVQITSHTVGSYKISVSCSAENHQTATAELTAVFTLPSATFSPPDSVAAACRQSVSITLGNYPQGTVFTASCQEPLSATVYQNVITITGSKVGSYKLSITAFCNGYQSTTATIPITINAVTATVSQQYSDCVQDILYYTNVVRRAYGLSQLKYAKDLETACAIRAKEASQKWSHDRPDGTGSETVYDDTGVAYYSMGENLMAATRLNGKYAVDQWMGSPDHKENIVRAEFEEMCIGIYKDDNFYYYAQLFIKRW